MVIITPSQSFMEKFGDIWHETKESHYAIKSIFYRLDWRNKDIVNLCTWVNDQIKYAPEEIINLAESFNNVQDNDTRVWLVLKWTINNLTYVRNLNTFGVVEKWATAYETLTRWYVWTNKSKGEVKLVAEDTFKKPDKYKSAFRAADCDGGSTLILVLARLSGIPASQIRNVCGKTVQGFGHCWVRYRADCDGISRYLDWCFAPDLTVIRNRNFACFSGHLYKEEWWGYNDKRGYGRFKYGTTKQCNTTRKNK